MAGSQSGSWAGTVVVQSPDGRRQETAGMRAARIDRLGVDRSHFARYPLPIASPEMARGEQRLARRFGRSEVTVAVRLAAWRQFSRRLGSECEVQAQPHEGLLPHRSQPADTRSEDARSPHAGLLSLLSRLSSRG